MIYTLIGRLVLRLAAALAVLRDRCRPRAAADAGSTLEVVIIILGTIAIATLLVGALTHAAQGYINQIK